MDEESSEVAELVRIWKDVIRGREKSWVLFENGTCVILMEPNGDSDCRSH